MEITFVVGGEVVGKGRPRFTTVGGYARSYTPAKTASYEQHVRDCYKEQGGRNFGNSEISLEVVAYYQIPKSANAKVKSMMKSGKIRPMKKPDVDNVLKAIADALNGIAYADDKQIVSAKIEKRFSEDARAVITIHDN